MDYQQNVYLAPYTTFKIGGPVKYFVEVKDEQELIEAVDFARRQSDLPYFILGGGSNLLVSDQGFNGLVIKNRLCHFQILGRQIVAQSGALLADLVSASAEAGLTGLEWAVGIPGTIGGAVKVNASAFGKSVSELVEQVKESDKIISLVKLGLKKGDCRKSREAIKDYLSQRSKTQPLRYPSAGCIFKNPPADYAGRLIEQAGLKGRRIGQVQVSQKHANFIINLGKGRASQVKELIDLIKQEVEKKSGAVLEEEIDYLGFGQ